MHPALAERGRCLCGPYLHLAHRLGGKIYNLLKQDKVSEKEFQMALSLDRTRLSKAEIDWEHAIAFRSMGETYNEMGNKQLALQYLWQALAYERDYHIRREILYSIMLINSD